jgi:hypothetical protein
MLYDARVMLSSDRLRRTSFLRVVVSLVGIGAVACGGGLHTATVPEIQPDVTGALDYGTSGIVARVRVVHECALRMVDLNDQGTIVRKRELVAYAFPCQGEPVKQAPIWLVAGKDEIAVGATDDKGELYCNLVTALGTRGQGGGERAATGVFVYKDARLGVVPLATVDLTRVYQSAVSPTP